MKDDEMRKAKRYNKKEILEKLKESILSEEVDSEEVDSEGIEDLSRNVDSPDDSVKIVRRVYYEE